MHVTAHRHPCLVEYDIALTISTKHVCDSTVTGIMTIRFLSRSGVFYLQGLVLPGFEQHNTVPLDLFCLI